MYYLSLAAEFLFDRIAVLLRSPDVYRPYLEEAFNRAGIPAHFARGAVRPDPAGRALCALLKCAADGLSARRFAEYLSLGQVPDATSEGAPPEAIPGSERWSYPLNPSSLNSRRRKPLKNSNPFNLQRTTPMTLLPGKGTAEGAASLGNISSSSPR